MIDLKLSKVVLTALVIVLYCTSLIGQQADCNDEDVTPSDFCNPDVIVCELTDYCNTMTPYDGSSTPVSICNNNISLDNPTWFGFIATSSTVTIEVTPSACLPSPTNPNNIGMQLAIVDGCPDGSNNYPTVGNCFSMCTEGPATISSSSFVVGQQYYLLLDGCSGSVCDYQITLAEGIQFPDLTNAPDQFDAGVLSLSGPLSACPGETVTIEVVGDIFANNFNWILDSSIPYNSEDAFLELNTTGFAPGTYEVCLENASNPCSQTGAIANACFTFEIDFLPIDDRGLINHCAGTPYEVDGQSFTTSGIKVYTITTPEGCDQDVTLNLNIIENTPVDQSFVLCASEVDDFFPFLGEIFDLGDYVLDRTDEFGCDSSFNVSIDVISVDFSVLDLEGLVVTCPSDPLILDAAALVPSLQPSGQTFPGGIISWEWIDFFGNVVSSESTVEISAGGFYTLRVTADINGVICNDLEVTFNVEEDFPQVFEPIITGEDTGCIGQTVELTLSNYNGFDRILWQDGFGALIVGPNDEQTVTLDLLSAVEGDLVCVNVTAPDCDDFFEIGCFEITIGDQLDLELVGETGFCEGGSTQFTLEGDYLEDNIIWSDGQIGSEIIIDEPGTYTVMVTDQAGCIGTEEIIIEQYDTPAITFGGSPTFCTDLSTTITVQEDYSEYLWSTGETTPAVIINVTGEYTVTVTNEFGCTNEETILVEERDELSPSIQLSQPLCEGGSAELSVGDFDTYEWSVAGETGPTITITEAGEYTVMVSENNCPGTAIINVVLNQNPVAQIDTPREGVCPDEEFRLTALPADLTYQWNDGSANNELLISAGGTYSVIVTDDLGCSNEVSIDIESYVNPVFDINGDDYYCENGDVLISVDSNFEEYEWSNGETTQSITVNEEGSYSVLVTNADGCSDDLSIEIEEKATPVPTINGELDFCAGDNTSLSIEESYDSYLWSVDAQTTDEITVSTGGIVSVEVTDEFGCVGTNDVTIVENALPTPTIVGSTTFCVGLSTTLDGGDYESFEWSGPISGDQSTLNVTLPGEYCLVVTDLNGCVGSADCVEIIEDDELSFNISGDLSFCSGESTILDPGVFAMYTWGDGSTDRTLEVSSPGIYTVEVSDADGCTGSGMVEVTENSLPDVDIEGSNSFCTNQQAALSASDVFDAYLWSNGSTEETTEINEPGTVTLQVTDANGCINTATIEIEELEELMPTLTGEDLFCEGTSTLISVNETFESYLWLDNNSPESVREFTTGGTYTIQVTDANGCSGTGVISITEAPNPLADAGEDQLLTCQDNILNIGGQMTTVSNTSISWTNLETGEILGSDNAFIEIEAAGDYRIEVIDLDTGCSSEDTVSISLEENVLEFAEIAGTDPSCADDTDGVIELLGLEGGVAPFSYFIDGVSSAVGEFTSLGAGSYEISVIDANGCEYTEIIELINPEPITVFAGDDLNVDMDQQVVIDPVINRELSRINDITWVVNGTVLCSNCPDSRLSFLAERSGVYQIFVEDVNGCTASDELSLTVRIVRNVFIPTAFSPNGDGINDKFSIFAGRNATNVKSFVIFDRWGNMMYEVVDLPPNDDTQGWDGTLRGRILDPGVFIYSAIVEFEDGEELNYHGEVKLIR